MSIGSEHRTASVHVLCGLVCAGKTTLARRLARELPAVRFTRDEWMIRLHGLRHDDPAYAERLPACTDLIWDVATDVLAAGRSVVLDWAHWSREQRSDAARRAAAAGHSLVVHYLDVPVDTAIANATRRAATQQEATHRIDADGVRHFATIFQPPHLDEGLRIVTHTTDEATAGTPWP